MNGIDSDVISAFMNFLTSPKCPSTSVKISCECVRARHDEKMTNILSLVGSLTAAKAHDCIETDRGYIFKRGINYAWDEVTVKDPCGEHEKLSFQQTESDIKQTEMSTVSMDLPIRVIENKECFFEITDLSQDQEPPVVRILLTKVKEWIEINQCNDIKKLENFKPLQLTVHGNLGSEQVLLLETVVYCTDTH
eukprot:scaffold20176_cov62-Attheya_sp.AAC.1